jgi:eukaryotic-like serine/threonine-protein kinase
MSAPDKPDDPPAEKAQVLAHLDALAAPAGQGDVSPPEKTGQGGVADDTNKSAWFEATVPPDGKSTIFLSPSSFVDTAEGVDSTIGPYKLVQTLGEGGMGTVWLAQQEKPIRRSVALKIIKLGMDTREVIARFEAERQALALMDHPNIAKVLDAGATDTGRPYFVMELVRGVKITAYCDENHLSARDRLELFIKGCRAIQHAHQKGIIHRDIKPSNMLVTIEEATPVPKVIDFGIAKATAGQQLTEKTLITAVAQILGTPAYMSPEQTRMGTLDIDTRTDIYSLGVLLYELLTGQTPFDPQELLSNGMESLRRIICEKEPIRPSAKLTITPEEARAAVAKLRRVASPNLIQLVRGDLDWIVMKCLEKDRTRRYQSASDLALDIQRHLDFEPVEARPPSNVYRFQKLVRRNKLAFASAVSLFVLLLAGTIISTWQARKALAADAVSKAEATKSKNIAAFLETALGSFSPWATHSRDPALVSEWLDEWLDQTAGTIQDLPGQSEVQAELYGAMGTVYVNLGRYPKAEELYRQAIDIQQKLPPSGLPQLAVFINNLGNVCFHQSKMEEAETAYRAALGMQTNLLGQNHPEIATNLATTMDDLARLLLQKRDLAGSETLYRQALDIRQKLTGAQSPETASSLYGLASILRIKGEFSQAESLYRKVLAIRRQLNDDQGAAAALTDLGNVLRAEGKLAEAEAATAEALGIYQQSLGKDHPTVALALNAVGGVLLDQGKWDDAEIDFRQALEIQTNRLEIRHDYVAHTLANLGAALQKQGRLPEAEEVCRQALDIWKQGRDNRAVAAAMHQLAGILQQQNKAPEAIGLYRECLAIRQKEQSAAWETFNTQSELGGSLQAQQQYREAEPLLLSGYQGLAERQRIIPSSSLPLLGRALERLVRFYQTNGPPEQAAAWQNKLARFNGENANSHPP